MWNEGNETRYESFSIPVLRYGVSIFIAASNYVRSMLQPDSSLDSSYIDRFSRLRCLVGLPECTSMPVRPLFAQKFGETPTDIRAFDHKVPDSSRPRDQQIYRFLLTFYKLRYIVICHPLFPLLLVTVCQFRSPTLPVFVLLFHPKLCLLLFGGGAFS
jgi:hypothetical protein